MESQSFCQQQIPVFSTDYSNSMTSNFSGEQSANTTSADYTTPMELHTDSFDHTSRMAPRDYYRLLVNELLAKASGGCALVAQCQPPISAATQEFLMATKKDPISLLHIYCSASDHPSFQFYDYEITKRADKNKFVMVTELDGKPIFGSLTSSKKEAKKACALRLIDQLMKEQRLGCTITETGRKIKKSPKIPKALQALSLTANRSQDQIAQLSDYYKNMPKQENPQMGNFAEDVDFDNEQEQLFQPKLTTMQITAGGFTRQPLPPLCVPEGVIQIFEQHNPVPSDCKNRDEYCRIRSHAFRLYCAKAFTVASDDETPIMDEMMREKLSIHGMGSERWNAASFVTQCIQRVNTWTNKVTTEGNQAEQQHSTAPTETEQEITVQKQAQQGGGTESQNQQFEQHGCNGPTTFTNDEKGNESQTSRISLEYFIFKMPPYKTPPFFVCLGLLNGNEIFYGQMAESKAKAKLSCAQVLAQNFVETGWANIAPKPKPKAKQQKITEKEKRRRLMEMGKAKKRKIFGRENESDGNESEEENPYQLLFTFHPGEQLDARTHFLLATNSSKNSIQLLNEIASRQQYTVIFEEEDANSAADAQVIETQNVQHKRFVFSVRLEAAGIPGLPSDYMKQHSIFVCGVCERNKRLAKQSAARIALDQIVRRGYIDFEDESIEALKQMIKDALFTDEITNVDTSTPQANSAATIDAHAQQTKFDEDEPEKMIAFDQQHNVKESDKSGVIEQTKQQQETQQEQPGAMIV